MIKSEILSSAVPDKNDRMSMDFLLFLNVTASAVTCTVNPRYNDSICSQSCCHLNEFAVVKNP